MLLEKYLEGCWLDDVGKKLFEQGHIFWSVTYFPFLQELKLRDLVFHFLQNACPPLNQYNDQKFVCTN